MPPQTIIDAKSAFLRTQILLLSQPLRASPTVLTTVTSAEENALRQKAIDEALRKANALLKKHVKVCYGPQAARHVAEQVDRVYWGAGGRGVGDEEADVEEWCRRGVDLRDDHIITQIPPQWSEEALVAAPEKAARYEELQGRLVEANEKRREVRGRLEKYRQMREMVGLLEGEGLQENLVVKNGEVEKELERMRMLMLRVERGLSGLADRVEGDEGEGMEGVLSEGDEEDEMVRRLFG